MPEPQTAKGRATRDHVIDTATALIYQRGVTATSLDDVRTAARVSKGQLYHYFADKDDLVHAVCARTINQVLGGQPEASDLSSWKGVRRWFDALVDLQRRHGGVGGCPIGGLAS